MNRIKYSYIKAIINTSSIIFVLVIAISCNDYFDKLNTPEDQIVASNLDKSSIGQAFAYSEYHGMRGQFGSGGYNQIQIHYTNMWVQYFASTSDIQKGDNFVDVGRWDDLGWVYFYENAAPQLSLVIGKTGEEGLDLENAVAKIWRVEIYHQMTDVWGPIPYSKFGNNKRNVPYDSQESIYNDFFSTLDEAVNVLQNNAGGNAFGTNDLVYDGNIGQWLKFANSLRLRLAMRIRYVDPSLAQKEAEKALADGVITSSSDNAMISTTENSKNPLTTITAWGEFRQAAAMESSLEGYKDPRLENYFNAAVNGDSDGDGSPYEGLRNGLPVEEKSTALNDSYSNMDTKWLPESDGGTNPSMEVMRAAEVYFLRAEGALQDWNMDGTAEELYNEGIRTSLKSRTDATESEIDAYINSSNTPAPVDDQWNTPPLSDIPIAFMENGSQEKKMEQIITQKWLAIFPNGWEAWAEYRRTGYPKLYPIITSVNPDVPENGIVRRLKFTTSEYNNNTKEVEKAVQLLSNGPDNITTRLWWDAKK